MNAALAASEALERRWDEASPLLDQMLAQADGEREHWLQTQQLDAELGRLLQRLLDAARASSPLDTDPIVSSVHSADNDFWQRRLGPWRVLRPIGAGGAASVFLGARDDGAFEQSVAIKILRSGVLDPFERQRFAQERQLLARLQHPLVARLIDGGLSPEGAPYLVLEYVDGLAIDAWCDQQRLDIRARLQLFLDVCSAVQFAHQHLIVHRDLKPSNILVDRGGQVKLLDFGIAKLLDGADVLTHTEARRMTPAYAAPEQIGGGAISTAVDVHALGVLLHELLSGVRPDARGSAMSQRVLDASPDALDRRAVAATAQLARQLRGDLQAIVETALRPDPTQRYTSVSALAEDIGRHLAGEPVQVRGDALWYRAGRWLQRHAIAVSAGVLLLTALLAAALFSWAQAQSARLQTERAEAVQSFLIDLLKAGAVDGERTAPTSVDELMRIAAERARTAFPESPQTRAQLLTTLGRLQHQQGRHDEAERSLSAAQSVETSQLGFDSGGSLSTRVALALLHSERAATEETLAELEGLLAEQRRMAVAPMELAENLQTIGYLHSRAGRHAQALPLLREAGTLSRGSARHGAALLSLGDAQARSGDDKAAMSSFRAALRVVPPRSIEYSRVQRSIGYALQRVNDWAGAQTALEESLSLQQTLLPADHPHTAQTLIALGALTFERADFPHSQAYFDAAYQMRLRMFGAGGVELAEALVGMGSAASAQGDSATAVRLLEEALHSLESLPLDQQHHRAWVLGNLSAALRKHGDAEQSLHRAEQAHALFQNAFGPHSDQALSAVVSIARARQALGQGEQALAEVRSLRAQLSDGALAAPIDLLIGHLALDLAHWPAARSAFELVLSEAKSAQLRADAHIGLADVALATQDRAAAQGSLETARELLKLRLPARHPRLLAIEQRLQ